MSTQSPEMRARLAFYGLDDPEGADRFRRAARMVAPHMPRIIPAIVDRVQALPTLGDAVAHAGPRLLDALSRHYHHLFGFRLDDAYVDSVHHLADIERGIERSRGTNGRVRFMLSTFTIVEGLKLIGERHRFSGRRTAALGDALARGIMFDSAMVMQALSCHHEEDTRRRISHVEGSVGAFRATISSIAVDMESMSRSLSTSAAVVDTSVDEAQSLGARAVDIVGRCLRGIDDVMATTTRLLRELDEVALHSVAGDTLASRAVADVERSVATIRELAGAVQRIGSVIHFISDVAEQSNLLALNATIEAARAGEAGRGFAVVAHEVKALADQTARATDELSAQIAAAQAATKRAAGELTSVGQTISGLAGVATQVRDVVQVQCAAARSIDSSIGTVRAEVQNVAASINQLAGAVLGTIDEAGKLTDWSRLLADRAAHLDDEVPDFADPRA